MNRAEWQGRGGERSEIRIVRVWIRKDRVGEGERAGKIVKRRVKRGKKIVRGRISSRNGGRGEGRIEGEGGRKMEGD